MKYLISFKIVIIIHDAIHNLLFTINLMNIVFLNNMEKLKYAHMHKALLHDITLILCYSQKNFIRIAFDKLYTSKCSVNNCETYY